jgi:hypothetical protein
MPLLTELKPIGDAPLQICRAYRRWLVVLSAKGVGIFSIMDTGEASLAKSSPWKYQAARQRA